MVIHKFIQQAYLRRMTGIDRVQLEKVVVHKVGNPSRGEPIVYSEHPLTLNDDLVNGLLTKYFLGSFNENDQYHFSHISDLELNEVYSYVSRMFEEPKTFMANSALLAHFLYSKSTHVRVKEGEMYIAQFKDIPLGDETLDAIGIFKSETKETFLRVFPQGKSFEVLSEEGININKLDKGCLIFRKNKEEGYVVCVIDSNGKQNETQYWIKEFLQVEPYADSYHHTDQALSMCKLFISNEYADKFETNKSEQIDMLNRSMDYFKTRDKFNMQEFADEVIYHPEVAENFMEYRKTFESSRQYQLDDEFAIHVSAVKKQAKVFKSVLKLDRNFHVYIHGRNDLIEKGWDEPSGKHFYKLYFEEES
jgi:hypothetical protein